MPIVYPITLNRYPLMAASRELFVNLRVNDLPKSMAFFAALGFTFNKQFTDDNAACMVISDLGYVMLLTDPFFRRFSKKEPMDTARQIEGMFAVSCVSRAEVDALMEKAMAAGATPAMPVQDHGFMYSQSFHDLDGHHWEVLWMDPTTIQ
jgi:predicted lactoylglutathione lyase